MQAGPEISKYMVNVLKFWTLVTAKKAKTNRADPDQTEEAV